MQIGQLAEQSGLSRDTLRFYEKCGLIKSARSGNGYRVYADDTTQLLTCIRTAQQLGFSLAEISQSLEGLWSSQVPEQVIVNLLALKVEVIDEKIETLLQLKLDLLERIRLSALEPCSLSAQMQKIRAEQAKYADQDQINGDNKIE